MAEEFILRSVDIERDAEALARMWNESDDQWPGSWTGGVPMTAERIKRWYREEDALDVLVWATPEGAIVGYCSLQKRPEEEGVAYVAVLNIHPAYQRRSLGRKMLQTYVERCIKLGFKRLDLHTWSGNLKSVPLYKKTGFFWMPDAEVLMLNFLPTILQLPCARPYFARHDWYKTYVHRLGQHEDDERWRGMKVFTYHWEEDGDALTVWADREGRSLTAVETDGFAAAAIPDNIAPPKGLEMNMRWELRNKNDRPLSVSLIARGTEHLKLDYRDNFTVPPGETVERVTAVSIDARMPRVQKRRPAPKIQTLLLVDGELLELGTGLRPEPAVVVETMPRRFTTAPGAERTIHVQLRNALDMPVKGHLSLVAPPGLTISRNSRDVDLPPYGQLGLPLTVQAQAPGVHPIQAFLTFTMDGKQGEAAPQELPIVALYPGQVMVYEEEGRICVDADRVSYGIRYEGGRFEIFWPEAEQALGGIGAEYGPPYDPSEFRHQQAELSWRREEGGIVVETRFTSRRFPGLVMLRELHFSGGPLVKIVYRTLNRGDKPHTPELRQFFHRRWEDEYQVILPLRSRLLRASTRTFPRGDEECPRKSEDYAEKWVAFEAKKGTVGLIWNPSFDEVNYEWAFALQRARFDCPPHQWAELCSTWLYIGSGDWRDVQRAYLHLSGKASSTLPSQTEPIVALSLEPVVPMTQSGTLATTLKLENRRQQALKGNIRLAPTPGWRVEPTDFTCEGVDRWHPFTAKVILHQNGDAPGAYALQAHLSTRLDDTQHTLPFLRLGDGGKVEVQEGEQEGQPIYTMDNRRTCFVVAPRFSAAVVAWKTTDGINHLDTCFPQVGAKSWLAPWYGGIWPMVRTLDDREPPGKLYMESFEAQPALVKDGREIAWQGVRLTSALQREELRGLRLELEYLTTGGSPLLKAVYRLVNRTEAVRKVRGGWMAYWAVDGDASQSVLRGQDWESKRTDFLQAWVQVPYWGCITNPTTGRTAVAVCPELTVLLVDEGRNAAFHFLEGVLTVPPSGTIERVAYFALAPDFDSARAYACLKD